MFSWWESSRKGDSRDDGSQMKILIGMTRSDTVLSGSFRHISQIGDRFRKEGVEVIYVIGGRSVAFERLEEQGFRVISLSSLKRNLNLFYDFVALLQLVLCILKERPDVCSWHTAKIGALGRIASFLTFRRSFYVPHGVPFVNTPENKGYKIYQVLEKVLSVLPSRIIGVCDFDRKEYVRIGVSKDKVLVIKNGMAEPAAVEPPGEVSSGGLIRFITAARFEAQKDYQTLALAVHKLEQVGKPYILDIYGDGQLELSVREMFSGLQVGKVEFKGVVKDFTVPLSEADVFVLSSHWEGLPRSIIEAMACSKAVIASDVGGSSELVSSNQTGFLVAHKDAEGMFRAMSAYIDEPELALAHGRNGHQKYIESYTLEKMLDSYVSVYMGRTLQMTVVEGQGNG